MILIQQPPDYQWCKIENGKITYLDWDFAEKLAQAYKDGIRMDQITVTALLAIALREHILEMKIPEIKKEPSK